jgi:hypothetical protein
MSGNQIVKAMLIAASEMADKVSADAPEFADVTIRAIYPLQPYDTNGVQAPRVHRWDMRIVADELEYERWTSEDRL